MSRSFAVAQLFVALISGVGLLSAAYAGWLTYLSDVDTGVIGAEATFLRSPSAALAFSVLFAAGGLAAIRLGNVVWIAALLPVLVLAMLPVFTGRQERGIVPIGGILAFQETFTVSGETAACPAGWREVTALAGRFPLGAGEGERGPRRVGDLPIGSETALIEVRHLPSHRHELPADSYGRQHAQALWDSPNPDEGLGGNTQFTGEEGGDEPLDIMPPASVVQFCMRQE